MKWNFLYQITAASRTPEYMATAPRSPFSSSCGPKLNLLTPPPRSKFLGMPLISSWPVASKSTLMISSNVLCIRGYPWQQDFGYNLVSCWRKWFSSIITTIRFPPFLWMGKMTASFRSTGNPTLFQIQQISLRISEQIVLPRVLINYAGIWSLPGDMCLFTFQ